MENTQLWPVGVKEHVMLATILKYYIHTNYSMYVYCVVLAYILKKNIKHFEAKQSEVYFVMSGLVSFRLIELYAVHL